jgi:hypothetical protein
VPSYRRGKWKARIKHNYKERYIGDFDTFEEAVQAERALRFRLTGREDPMIGEAKVQWQLKSY